MYAATSTAPPSASADAVAAAAAGYPVFGPHFRESEEVR
jgi:hypothetical protein